MTESLPCNQLAGESSPYLLQHARNPVDWHPWTESALALARSRKKPILLSIGYSACHWCHVMAHESFENPEIAAFMNQAFVNIKVDREERPDLDRVYQLAHQILAQRSGGWPLTVFLTPDDLTPFFAGTYFPPESRYGLPAFKEVLTQVTEFYQENQDQLRRQNDSLKQIMQRIEQDSSAPAQTWNVEVLETAQRTLEENFDAHFGGFGRAPKFPQTPALEFLLWRASDHSLNIDTRQHAREMLTTTLTRMAEGGIYDQLGGGFSRYSVDAAWTIPHFEKMLYDNGTLLALYARTGKFTGHSFYVQVAHGIAAWVIDEMQSPDGGYYASIDADSEGREGAYYLWEREDLRARLNQDEYAVFAARYGLDGPANFEDRWHLRVYQSIPDLIHATAMDETRALSLLVSARQKLLVARSQRIRPGLDDKVLTAWNGLMIGAMACAGRLLDQAHWIDSAERAAQFIHTHLWRAGTLQASWRGRRMALPGYLDDYAFLLDGLVELIQARWNKEWLDWARALADRLLDHFEDHSRGGFWFTADDQPVPLYRPKNFGDESMPAGNALAIRALLRLGHLCAEPRYLTAAERALKAALPSASRFRDGHLSTFTGLIEVLKPPDMFILRGTKTWLEKWHRVLDENYDPRRIVLSIPNEEKHLRGLLEHCKPRGDICAYRCRGTSCSLPLTTLTELAALASP